MLERADAAARDDGHVHRVADRAQQVDVVPGLGAVAVHRGEQDLAGAEVARVHGPLDRVEAGRRAPAVGHDLPARARVIGVAAAGVDRDDDALRRRTRRRPPRRSRDRSTAAVLSETLSAPARSMRRTSSTLRIAAADRERDEHLARRRARRRAPSCRASSTTR